ncbi:MAG: ATP synthase subunit I [Gammaproteobacteria bacterium]|nr:ATP synthase subunit I [Gammaproteobacteria bacterium]
MIEASPIRALAAQLATTLLAAAIGWVARDATTGFSALVGGMICTLPNAFFAWRLFGARVAPDPSAVYAFYRAEIGKLILTGALFALAFWALKELNVLVLFLTFGLAVFSGVWAATGGDARQNVSGN